MFLAKTQERAHDGRMGEKPLGIDEAPARMGTIAGSAPLGGGDVPPPAMAAGVINTTRSNIKSTGSAKAASPPPKDLEPTPTRPGDPFPDEPGPAGIAIKENGIKVDGGAAGAERVGQTAESGAMEGDPVPGLDVKLGSNKPGAASAVVPGAEVYDTPDGDELDPMAVAGGINTTRSNIKHSGSATAAGPSGATPVGGTSGQDPPPFDNDTGPPGEIDLSGAAPEGDPESVTIKGSDGSTLTLTQLPTDVNVMELMEADDPVLPADLLKKKA